MPDDARDAALLIHRDSAPSARRRQLRPGPRLVVVLIGATAALFASNNWCFVVLPATIAAILVDCLVCAIRPRFVARVVAAVVVGVVTGLMLNVGPKWAFQEAFGTDPPSGIRNVRISRHYLGGPGEHALIIEFMADPNAFQTLVQSHAALSGSERVARWRAAGGQWAQAFDAFVLPGPTFFARSAWQQIRPLERPEILELGEVNGGSLVLFREAGTDRCVALHVRS